MEKFFVATLILLLGHLYHIILRSFTNINMTQFQYPVQVKHTYPSAEVKHTYTNEVKYNEVKYDEQKQRIRPPTREVTLVDGRKCANCYYYGCECANCQGMNFPHIFMTYDEYRNGSSDPQLPLTYAEFLQQEENVVDNTDDEDDLISPPYEPDYDI